MYKTRPTHILLMGLLLLSTACTRVDLAASDDTALLVLSTVPAPVSAYVQTHFSNLSVDSVNLRFNTDGSFRKYEMHLSNSQVIYFDILWAPLFDDSAGIPDQIAAITLETLPQSAQDYLISNYAGMAVNKVLQKLDAAGSPRLFEVRLKPTFPKLPTHVYFEVNGRFAGIKN